MSEWQPIETAPRQQRVLISATMPTFKNRYVGEAIHEWGKWWWANKNHFDHPGEHIIAEVTHWQPLPDPPA